MAVSSVDIFSKKV